MLAFQDVGVMHKELNPQLRVVECYQSPLDFVLSGETVKTGDWLMTVKVLDNEIWEKVEKGGLPRLLNRRPGEAYSARHPAGGRRVPGGGVSDDPERPAERLAHGYADPGDGRVDHAGA